MTPSRERLLTQLWAEQSPRLLTWLKGQCGAAAEDILQDTYLRLHQSSSALTEKVAWKTAMNLLTDYRRREDKRPDDLYLLEELIDIEERGGVATSFPTEAVVQFRDAFDRAFRALPRELAEAFTLTDLRGLTTREAADELGVSHISVSRRADAARTHLKERIS